MSRTRLLEWHRRFKEGREEVEDDRRSGRPSTSRTDENVERVRQKMRGDRYLTVRMIANELGKNSERVWRIITEDLGMRKICSKMVPRLLNEGQKERRVQVCQDILEQLETEPNLVKSYWRWVMDLRVRFTHQTAEPWMEKRIVTKTQKGEGVQVQNPRWCWSLFLMSMELSTQNSCHKAKLIISTSTKTFCDVWCAQWGRKEENCGKREYTMLQLIMPWKFGSFLPKITLLYWSNHPTLQIWPLVTSFCFPKSKKSSKKLVFKIQKPLKQPWRESSERSRRNGILPGVRGSVAEEIGKVHSNSRLL